MDNEISWIWGVVLVILLIPAIHLFVDLLNSSSSPGQTQARRDKSNYQQLMYFEARATRKVRTRRTLTAQVAGRIRAPEHLLRGPSFMPNRKGKLKPS